MGLRPFKPCPVHITDARGRRIYCDQGEDNHWGTCVGIKTEDEYLRQLKAWEQAQRAHGA